MTTTLEMGPVGVIGLGLLGRELAASMLGAGFHVIAFENEQQAGGDAVEGIESALAEMVAHAVTSPAMAHSWRTRYVQCSSWNALEPCVFVLDTLFQDRTAKHSMYDELEAVVGIDVPIAINSSAFPVTTLQSKQRSPGRFIGMHWAPPAYATRFLEVARGEQTSDATMDLALQLARALGKEPCITAIDLPGFIVNRLCYAMYREAAFLLEHEIADAETIDVSFRNACGLWATLCGPLRWIDITGGPALYAEVMRDIIPTLSKSSEVPAVFAQKQEDDERGTTNDRGFYHYEDSDGVALWYERYRDHAWEVRRLQDEYFPLPRSS